MLPTTPSLLPRALLVAPTIAACAMVALLLTCPRPSGAQEPAQQRITVHQVDASHWPQISAVVSVLDEAGIPIGGLTAADVGLDGQGAILAVTGTQDQTLGVGVALVIDISGSMEGTPLAAARAAASAFVARLGPNDSAAVYAFSDRFREVVPFTRDRQALEAGVQGLQSGGSTALYDAVEVSAASAGAFDGVRKAIVLLSDGENDTTIGTGTAAGSIAAVRAAGVPVFAVGYGSGSDGGYLTALATETHGSYFPADASDIGTVYEAIGSLLRNQYVLTIRDDGEGAAPLRLTVRTGGETLVSEPLAYTRPVVPVQPTVAAPTASAPAQVATRDGSSTVPVLAIAAVVVVVAVVLLTAFAVRRWNASRAQAQRERLAGRMSDQEVPSIPVHAPATPPVPDIKRGRIVALDGSLAGQAFELVGDVPVLIGSDPSVAVRLEGQVAARHASVSMNGSRMTLRNMSGGRYQTFVGDAPVELVILDDGDEFSVGATRFRAEVRSRTSDA